MTAMKNTNCAAMISESTGAFTSYNGRTMKATKRTRQCRNSAKHGEFCAIHAEKPTRALSKRRTCPTCKRTDTIDCTIKGRGKNLPCTDCKEAN